MTFDVTQLFASAPLLALLTAGVALLLLEAFTSDSRQTDRGYLMPLTVGACVVTAGLLYSQWDGAASPRVLFGGMLALDRLSLVSSGLFVVTAALSAMQMAGFMKEHRFEFGEFYALLLFGAAGMMILAAATDLVSVFIGIETMSMAVYVLTGSWRRSPKSSEGAMKYFLTGAFATAILLYGMALVYGAVGSTNLKVIADSAVRLSGSPIFLIGMLFILAALAFKVAAVPFHMWAPDAYEGAPSPVTGFMAAGVKAAAFVGFIRLFGDAFGKKELAQGVTGWANIVSVLAVITMTVGNLAALRQTNIKRLLAYSSVAHAGYLLIGVVAMGIVGGEAKGPLLFYLAGYTFTTLGAFGVVAWIGKKGDERLELEDWAGLGWRHPAAALAMTVFMLSLGGVPPTAGFFGKFYLFRAALAKPGLAELVVIAVLNSVVSIAYYLKVVTAMYFREPGREMQPSLARGTTTALLIAVLATLALGLFPGWLVSAVSAG